MEHIQCDVLVIGGGAAGSRAALEAKQAAPGLNVLVLVDHLYSSGGSTIPRMRSGSTSILSSPGMKEAAKATDRKSTRLNSSH